MDTIDKIDIMLQDEIVTGDVETNTAQGSVDIINKKKKKKKKIKNESSVIGDTYISGNSNIAGSGQTRFGFITRRDIFDLARKEKVKDKKDNPTDTNILGREGLKFNKKSGAYIPSFWIGDK